jgi:hypothetical protein
MNRFRCVGHLALCLATGLLVQIVAQIKLLMWLPDFPTYDALALVAGVFALIASLSLLPSRHVRHPLTTCLWGVLFVALALSHAGLAAKSASLVVQQWRDIALWPTLVSGLAACLVLPFPQRSIASRLLIIWTLGEAFVAIFAAWYAPSFGEATNFATFRYLLYQMLITTAAVGATWFATPAANATRTRLARLALVSIVTCLTAVALMLFSGPIGNALLALLLLRFVVTLYFVYQLLQETQTDKEMSLSV